MEYWSVGNKKVFLINGRKMNFRLHNFALSITFGRFIRSVDKDKIEVIEKLGD